MKRLKIETVGRNMYYCTLSCGERYVALPSSPRGLYNIYYVCQDCDDLMYLTSKSAKDALLYFAELESDLS